MSTKWKLFKWPTLTFALLGIFCFPLMAIGAQETLKLKGRMNVMQIIQQIEKSSKFVFFYDAADLDGTTSKVIDYQGTINGALDTAFAGSNVTYVIKGNEIILKANRQNAKQQQNKERTITGIVTDASDGGPLIGVNITVKGSNAGTITNLDGKYSINISIPKATLVFSYVGYQKREAPIEDSRVINVAMQGEQHSLNEVVVVGSGVQKKISVTGAITSIKGVELRLPSTALSNSFAGRLAGVISSTRSGEPGAGSEFYIRGISTFGGRTTPLILLDDVEISQGDLNYVPAENIESFSILKDASATAIYGARGANGVMIVTTKGGDYNTKTKVTVSLENSFNFLSEFPDFVDGATYMELYNKAALYRNPNLAESQLRYSPKAIQLTRDKVNPYVYPDVDWADVVFKKMATTQRANINVSGGGSKVKYYMSLNVSHDTGLLNTKKEYSWNSNINIMNYTFQNNISYKLTPTTTVRMNMNAQIRQNKGPNVNRTTLFNNVLTTTPVYFPVAFPIQEGDTHIRYGTITFSGSSIYTNPYAQMVSSYKEANQNTLNTVIKIDQDFDFITKGLKGNVWANFKNWSSTTYTRSIAPYYYTAAEYNVDNPMEYQVLRVKEGADYITESDLSANNNRMSDQTFEFQANINYSRQFGLHNIGAMLLYKQREYRSAILPNRNQGVSGRLTYDYGQRYLAEFNFGYNGTERLQKSKRFGFFPAMSVGWVISNEKFFEPLRKSINSLKIRGSIGLVGSDDLASAGGSYYLYIDKITNGSLNSIQYTTGDQMNFTSGGPEIAYYANPNVVWEKAQKFDIGVDMKVFDDWTITAEYFYDKRYDIFMQRVSWPSSLAYDKAKPWGNVGKMDNKGFEFSIKYQKSFTKNLAATFQGNITYNKNKIIYKDEPDYPTIWKSETGKPWSRVNGYIAEGLFQSQEEIDNSPEQLVGKSIVMVGDLKYRDLNGDGKITTDDQSMISKYGDTPRLQYGFGGTINYKNFDFGIFFSGSALRSIMINGLDPFLESTTTGSRNVLSYIANNYWTEERPNAAYPRLGLTTGDIGNNQVNSSYWLRNGAFLRLKNLEIGYTIPYGRLYVSGANLIRFSPFNLWDPELAGWNSYPMQRTINVGLQLNF